MEYEQQQTQKLTPETLRMARTRIAFSDTMLRIFNGRGAISVRDKTLTGLQNLQFPPVQLRHYQFRLAFFERSLGGFIQDIAADVHDYMDRVDQGVHPLGLNSYTDHVPTHIGYDPHSEANAPMILLLQKAEWQPNRYYRVGTFHKFLQQKWVSFRIETVTSVSAVTDEIFLEVRITNRGSTPLTFTLIPDQRIVNPASTNSYPLLDTLPHAPFRLIADQSHIEVMSDLSLYAHQGWNWEIPALSNRTAYFAIRVQTVEAVQHLQQEISIAQRMQQADEALRQRLRWAEERLPQIQTQHEAFDEFYQRCIFTVLECRWERENFILNPFYAAGTWLSTLAWDVTFAAEMLSMLDPQGLRKSLLAYIEGSLDYSWLQWDGRTFHWYAQSPFSLLEIIQAYLNQTGDIALLDTIVNDRSVLAWLKLIATELRKRYGREDELLDFGPDPRAILEMRTDGYQHMVATTNGLVLNFYQQLALWCLERHEAEAEQFEQWAQRLHQSMNEKLWNEEMGWFDNLYPDGSHQLVFAYHVFDMLDAPWLSASQRDTLIAHLQEGEFIGPFGLYSMSPLDTVHYDQEDADWGGGGQYIGMPLRIVENAYRQGYPDIGWKILSRCMRWIEAYPYFPQEVFTDYLGSSSVEMPLQISAGSGVQAIIHGVFGLHPSVEGKLEIHPARNKTLGIATLKGYRFHQHIYDVLLQEEDFVVYCDNKLVTQQEYGTAFITSSSI